MNLKVLIFILLYYAIFSIIILSGGSVFEGEVSSNINLNDSSLSSDEIDTGGLFNTGVSFSRFFTLIGFGIGLPDDTPAFINTLLITWQTLFSIFVVGFIISSIWNG